MVVSQDVLAKKFRYFASELRDLRRQPHQQREYSLVKARFGHSLCHAVEIDVLPPAIANDLTERFGEDPIELSWDLTMEGFDCVVGYSPKSYRKWNPHLDTDFDETYGTHIELHPGSVAKVWPGLFEQVHSRRTPISDDYLAAAEELFQSQSFQIIGFHALACELLADWIEKQVDYSKVDLVAVSPSGTVSDFDKDRLWLAERFDELSRQFPRLSLIFAKWPEDVEKVDHFRLGLPDGSCGFPIPIVGGRFAPQCLYPPKMVKDRIGTNRWSEARLASADELGGKSKSIKFVAANGPLLSFPQWLFDDSTLPSPISMGIWACGWVCAVSSSKRPFLICHC